MPLLPVLATFGVCFLALRLIVVRFDPPYREPDEGVMVLEPPYPDGPFDWQEHGL